jgi:hypothetical protein
MEKASRESESEAMRGSPSPWNVFARTARDAPERARRDRVSGRESEVVEAAAMMEATDALKGMMEWWGCSYKLIRVARGNE